MARTEPQLDEGAKPRPVVLTTDCGTEMDDQWAIAHLATSPAINLLGIVTTHAPNVAPPAAETAKKSVEEVLDQLRLEERPPVFAGKNSPLPSGPTPITNEGVEFIIEQSKAYTSDNRLTVLAIGAATDLASVLLLDPTMTERIEIVAMGFDGWPDGNDVWNIKNDIPAWQMVMASRVPLTVGDSAICIKKLVLDGDEGHAILDKSGKAGTFLSDLLTNWINDQASLVVDVTGRQAWPVWDEIVVAHLLGLTTTETYPRPVLNDDMSFDHPGPNERAVSIDWIVDVDADALWADLAARVGKASID
jgi:inosine-uridine nucleoside N-ribohydrolase